MKGNHNIRVERITPKIFTVLTQYNAHRKSFIFIVIQVGNCYERVHALDEETEAVTG